ncbi:AEC family transporter [Anaerolineales bacterium HSG6]|nr:AEC family transporter [Anaerolineales bacterium HSG6]MDM8531036.1 AEC family transporter [Anaerolineales bacterium HSG25]
MELLLIFINIVTPVFALVVMGYVAGPRLALEARTLSRAAYYLFVPAFTFNVISTASIELTLAARIMVYIIIVHVACSLLAFGIAKLLRRSAEITAAYIMIASFGNIGNFGLSIVEFGLGESALVPATFYFIAIVLVGFIICVGAASSVRGGGGLVAVVEVLKTPAIVAVIPATFFLATSFSVPLSVVRITSLLGQAMIPVMLVTLGVQLSEVKKPRINADVMVATGIRLIGGPVLAILFAAMFGVTGLERSAGVLQAGMPVAVLVSIIAIEYDIVPEMITTTTLFSTIASLFSLTILLSYL